MNKIFKIREQDYKAMQGMSEKQAEFYGISDRVLAYGIAAEYAIAECLDTADMWDTRYKNAIALAPRKSVRIKTGRFY